MMLSDYPDSKVRQLSGLACVVAVWFDGMPALDVRRILRLILLGMIVQRVSQRVLSVLLEEHLVSPLEMLVLRRPANGRFRHCFAITDLWYALADLTG